MSKPVFVKLKNKTLELRYSTKAFMKLEEDLSKPVSQLNDSVTDLVHALRRGVNGSELSIDEACEIVDEVGISVIGKKVSQAINEAPKARNDQKNLKKVV